MASTGPRTDPRKEAPGTAEGTGLRRPVLRILQPSVIADILEATPGEVRIGRDASCEIRLDDAGCSRFHARILVHPARRIHDPKVVIEDLGSTNGTFVNEERIARPRVLRTHDKIGIGVTLFAYLVLDDLELQAERSTLRAAMTDALTGLLNRRAFTSELERELTRARRRGWPLSLLMVDLDHFKRINDVHGHEAGDRVLQAVAHALAQNKRDEDVAGRHGGEELVVALPQTDDTAALVVAERLRAAIEALRIPIAGHDVQVTASIGVATSAGVVTSLGELFGAADAAMYRAKATGRNRVATLRIPT